jgi:dienelactone hydrolase
MRTLLSLCVLLAALPASADEPKKDDLAARLRELADKQLPAKNDDAVNAWARDVRARLQEANRADLEAWRKVETKEQWEKFRDERVAALKKSLGEFPVPPKELKVHITKTIAGDGYAIENTLFESRPGFWVTANLYCPAKRQARGAPGILIIHSHHNPKEQGELQDMGVTGARAGCYVLVMDQLGHGERRQHPFADAKSYPESFKIGRQDYYFRYNLGLQLGLVGESLVGWMAWDLMRGVDLLLKKPGIDPEKIILLGSVAGGGDPAAVTAALDPRIKCVVPFNFGGPQPETKPLGADAETTFNYAGGGSWESTRNLRDSARDDFLPWLIVASVAPRYLIHAHEFSWYGDRDPVWKRYQKIWDFYGAKDRLAFTHGIGTLTSKDPPGSHCNNIGPEHRKLIHAAFAKWFGIKATESKDRHPAEELRCWTEEARKELKQRTLNVVLGEIADRQLAEAERKRSKLTTDECAEHLRSRWKALLGVRPVADDLGRMEMSGVDAPKGCAAWTFHGNLLLEPAAKKDGQRRPAVMIVSNDPRWRTVKENANLIAGLIERGIAVCVLDTGVPRANVGRTSSLSNLSSSEQMLGTSTFATALREVRFAYQWLRKLKQIDGDRIAILGTSSRRVNPPDRNLAAPYDVDKFPETGDPFAGMLAAFVALYEPQVKAVGVRGGVLDLRPALDSPFVYLPHDAFVPNSLRAGDLGPVYAAVAPRPLRFEAMIDPLDRRYDSPALERAIKPIADVYNRNAKFPVEAFAEKRPDAELAAWLEKQLAR